jgi:hypothetical protein
MPLHEFRATVEKQSLAIVGSGPTGTEGANALDVADCLATPLHSATIVGEGHAATARAKPQAEGPRPQRVFPGRDPLRELMGPSRQVEKVRQQVAQVAGSPLTALIQGALSTAGLYRSRSLSRSSSAMRRGLLPGVNLPLITQAKLLRTRLNVPIPATAKPAT